MSWPASIANSRTVQHDAESQDEAQQYEATTPGFIHSQQAYAFVCNQAAVMDGDVLPGLCMLTETWLAKVRLMETVCGMHLPGIVLLSTLLGHEVLPELHAGEMHTI